MRLSSLMAMSIPLVAAQSEKEYFLDYQDRNSSKKPVTINQRKLRKWARQSPHGRYNRR